MPGHNGVKATGHKEVLVHFARNERRRRPNGRVVAKLENAYFHDGQVFA